MTDPRDPIEILVKEIGGAIGPYGWSISVQRTTTNIRFQFSNPLSPTRFDYGDQVGRDIEGLRQNLLRYINTEPELIQTRKALAPPGRTRPLLRVLRGAAGRNRWSSRTFGQVVDVLRESRLVSDAEAEWLEVTGPTRLA